VLRRMQHHAGSAVAIAVDVDAWIGASASGGATRLLAQQGWRATALRPRDRLESVWQELAHTSTRSSRSQGSTAGHGVPS
jgi:hypothetical protein